MATSLNPGPRNLSAFRVVVVALDRQVGSSSGLEDTRLTVRHTGVEAYAPSARDTTVTFHYWAGARYGA